MRLSKQNSFLSGCGGGYGHKKINEVRCIGDGEGKGAKQSLCGIQRQEP